MPGSLAQSRYRATSSAPLASYLAKLPKAEVLFPLFFCHNSFAILRPGAPRKLQKLFIHVWHDMLSQEIEPLAPHLRPLILQNGPKSGRYTFSPSCQHSFAILGPGAPGECQELSNEGCLGSES